MLGQRLEAGAEPGRVRVVRDAAAFVEGQGLVRDHEVGVELKADAEAGALGAGAVGGIEREEPRLHLRETDVAVGAGSALAEELVDLGAKAGVVEKSGAWFSYDSQRLGQGRENAKAFLRQNPEIAQRIELAIRENAGLIADKILDSGSEEDGDGDED